MQVRQGLEEGIRGEVEGYRAQLEGVKAELAPWEKQMKEVQSRIDVAASECDLLMKQHEDAKQRYADAQLSLKAAQETASNKGGQIKEMQAAVDKYRWGGGGAGREGGREGATAGGGGALQAGKHMLPLGCTAALTPVACPALIPICCLQGAGREGAPE